MNIYKKEHQYMLVRGRAVWVYSQMNEIIAKYVYEIKRCLFLFTVKIIIGISNPIYILLYIISQNHDL